MTNPSQSTDARPRQARRRSAGSWRACGIKQSDHSRRVLAAPNDGSALALAGMPRDGGEGTARQL